MFLVPNISPFSAKYRAALHLQKYADGGRTNKKGTSQEVPDLFLNGAPGAIRTPDPLVRSQVLYPTELRARTKNLYPVTRINLL